MTSECVPGPLPRLLGCADCDSLYCAGLSLAVIAAAFAVLIAVAYLYHSRQQPKKVD